MAYGIHMHHNSSIFYGLLYADKPSNLIYLHTRYIASYAKYHPMHTKFVGYLELSDKVWYLDIILYTMKYLDMPHHLRYLNLSYRY